MKRVQCENNLYNKSKSPKLVKSFISKDSSYLEFGPRHMELIGKFSSSNKNDIR